MRVCSEPGCPEIYPKTAGRWCKTHRRAHDQARGTRTQRGYTSEHDRLRKQWAPQVATGRITCAKCGKPIQREQSWHLGHTDNRTTWTGPEHTQCNLSAAGVKSHRLGRPAGRA